jgi:hypothetical protein
MKHFVAVAAVAIAAAICAAPAFAQATLYRNTCTGSGCHASSTTPDRFSRNGESVDTIRGVPRADMQAALGSVSDTTLESIAAYIRAYNAGGTTASGRLTLSTSSLAFGAQPVATTSAARRVTATNTGTAAVSVTSVTSTNSEFRVAATSCAGSVAIGGTCTIDITFRPTDVGPRGGTISVVSNGTGSPQGIAVSGDGSATAPPAGATVAIKEYFHAAFGHYFITANTDEISKIDAGVFVGWAATGRTFKAYQNGGAGTAAVCRFFTTAFAPKSSHFYAPRGAGCEPVFENKDWQFEADAFYVAEASDAGACPAGTQPIYRLYNNGQTGAPNHRYTNDPAVRSQMITQGFIPEGKGPEGVGFCAPL